VFAAGEKRLYSSDDAGRRWRSTSGPVGLVGWPQPEAAYLVALDGRVSRSADAGGRWRPIGATGGSPAAFESAGGDLYVALHDGTIKRSSNGGRNWMLRSRLRSLRPRTRPRCGRPGLSPGSAPRPRHQASYHSRRQDFIWAISCLCAVMIGLRQFP
jgi:hypothetical protein